VIFTARYQTILFDADQTLLDFHRSEREALISALTQMRIQPSEEMIQKYSEINLFTWKRLEKGEITKKELRTVRFADFCAYYELELDIEKLADQYLTSLATQGFLLGNALKVCQTLAAVCRLYIITNGIAAVQHGRFDRLPLKPYFQNIFISDEIGAEKPSKAFFDSVKAQIPQFDPATTLVVGDSLTSDIAGGIAAGLDTCWLNAAGKASPSDLPITYTIKKLEEVIPLVLGT